MVEGHCANQALFVLGAAILAVFNLPSVFACFDMSSRSVFSVILLGSEMRLISQ